jgi:glutathione reductase (NADPH)
MYYSPWEMPPADKPKSYVKLICAGKEQRVVGLHIVGMAADEMVRRFPYILLQPASQHHGRSSAGFLEVLSVMGCHAVI